VPPAKARRPKNVAPTIVSSGNGRGALSAGVRILARGGSALDAVEACARIVESDPTDDTVGYGGLPNVLGVVELDASIVDGTSHAAGSVAALTGFLHPITVARAVMAQLPHVMLVGAGAARFAREIGAEEGELLTPGSRERWIERLRDAKHTPASIVSAPALAPVVAQTVEERGTVNFIAIDERGDIASAVTTSGWGFKYPGRVGDSRCAISRPRPPSIGWPGARAPQPWLRRRSPTRTRSSVTEVGSTSSSSPRTGSMPPRRPGAACSTRISPLGWRVRPSGCAPSCGAGRDEAQVGGIRRVRELHGRARAAAQLRR
jgi:hypothetical protein